MSLPLPIQRESSQEVSLLCDLTILCLFTKICSNIWPRTCSFLCTFSLAPFPACQFLHQYKERVHQEGLFLVWFNTIVCFQEKSVYPLGMNLLFPVHLQFGTFFGMSIPPPIQRESSPRRIVSCLIQHYCLFSRKECVSFGHELALFCARWARFWLLFVNDSFLIWCFAFAIWKCRNFTSLHFCYLIFNYSSPPQVAFASLDGNDNGGNVGSGSGSAVCAELEIGKRA
jgi:hypothetical protein